MPMQLLVTDVEAVVYVVNMVEVQKPHPRGDATHRCASFAIPLSEFPLLISFFLRLRMQGRL